MRVVKYPVFVRPAMVRFVCLAVSALILAACGSPDSSSDAVSGPKVVALNAAGTTFPNTAGESHWLQFEAQAKALSDGRIEPKMLIYGQLGSEEQIVAGLRRGRVQFANLSAMAVSTMVPEAALLYAPFLFDNEAEADFIFDTYLTDIYRELLAEKGLHLLSWYDIGFIQLYGKEPMIVPADAKGRRFRVGASLAAREFAGVIGADVIPLGFADVVSSLQTGLIEAGENAVSLYARTGIAAEAPHLTMSNHAYGVSMIVVQKRWWDQQSAEMQKALEQSFPSAVQTRADVREESQKDLLDAAALGIVVHELSNEQRSAWREVSRPVEATLERDAGGRSAEIMQLIREGREEHRRSQQ